MKTMSIKKMFNDGREYQGIFPLEKALHARFVECRVIPATRLASKTLPGIGLATFVLFLANFGLAYLPQTLAMTLFIWGIPIQAYLWLGQRANSALLPRDRYWYEDLCGRMRARGVTVKQVTQPTYKDLAIITKQAFTEVDKAFRDEWF